MNPFSDHYCSFLQDFTRQGSTRITSTKDVSVSLSGDFAGNSLFVRSGTVVDLPGADTDPVLTMSVILPTDDMVSGLTAGAMDGNQTILVSLARVYARACMDVFMHLSH